MKVYLVAVLLLFGINSAAYAGWERVSPDVIKLKGEIDRNSYAEYLKVSIGGYSRLILRSEGGVPLVALMIAEDVADRGVTVVVDGYCMSACANYLAFSGKKLVVNCDSFLAWHGTLATPDEAVSAMRADNKPEKLIAAYTGWLNNFIAREKSYYKKVGVDYQLLRDSTEIVREDKIVSEVDFTLDELTGDFSVSTSASLWAPTPDVLREYGVKTGGFCHQYTHEDIASMLEKRGVTAQFTSRGKRKLRK